MAHRASPPLLLAVSKGQSIEAIKALHALGIHDFGENYLQEAQGKIQALSAMPLSWHYIGRVQTNKTSLIAKHFDWVHTLCSLKHARSLNAARAENNRNSLQCCIQVNVGNWPEKAGIALSEIEALLEACASLPHLTIRGLMTLPNPSTTLAAERAPFHQLNEALEKLNQKGHALDTLSMGMSSDLKAAILEGATMVRVGTALFGPRHE